MIAPYRNPEAEKGFFRRPFCRARLYLSETLFERKGWHSDGRSVKRPVAWSFAAWVAFASAFYLGAMFGWW
jgi:hypothetical protein